MTRDELNACEPVLAALKAAGVISHYSFSSPSAASDHGFWQVTFTRSDCLAAFWDPFTECDVRDREALAYARQQHSAAIEATFALVKDRLLRDLAAVYHVRLLGKDLPIPDPVVISRIVIPLSPPAAPLST